MKQITKSDNETVRLGSEFSKKLKPGEVVFLFGDLGFGKTTFTKGVAEGLGIKERVISPTFTIVREHKVKKSKVKKLYHIDLYRLVDEKQIIELGMKEILSDQGSIKIVEWPEKLSKKKPNWSIYFEMNTDNTRTINIINHD